MSSALGFLSRLWSRGINNTPDDSPPKPETIRDFGWSRPPQSSLSPRLTYALGLVLDILPILAALSQELGHGFHDRDPRFEFLARIETATYLLQEHLVSIRESQDPETSEADISALADCLEIFFAVKRGGLFDQTQRRCAVPWPRLAAIRQPPEDDQDSSLGYQLLYEDLASLPTSAWRTFSQSLALLTSRLQHGALDLCHDQVPPKTAPTGPLMPDSDFKDLITDSLAAMACTLGCRLRPAREVRFRLGTYKSSRGPDSTSHVTILARDGQAETWSEVRLHAALEYEPHGHTPKIRVVLASDDLSETPPPLIKYPMKPGECVCTCIAHHRRIRPRFWRLNLQIADHCLASFWQDPRELPPESLQYQVTLKNLLSPHGAELTTLAGMSLSVMLAYSLFYLFGEPSVEGRWSRDNIVFYCDGDCIPLRPFLKLFHQTPNGSHANDRTFVRYPEFLELGVMLLEIFFCTSLEALLGFESDIETADEYLAAASQVHQTRILEIDQPGLRVAVKSCLSLAVSGKLYQSQVVEEDSDKEQIRALLFEGVVQHLESDLKRAFDELVSTDLIDEVAPRKIRLRYVCPDSAIMRDGRQPLARDSATSPAVMPGRRNGSSSPGPLKSFTLFNINTRASDPSTTGCSWADDWIKRFRSIVDTHIPTDCERLKVAVLDTGIDIKHPDFDAEERIKELRSWANTAAGSDKSGHGTHIVSTILSLTRNVDVYVAKIAEGNTIKTTDQIAEAIKVANKEWDVDIISLPFGFPQRIRGIRNEIRNALHDGKAVFAAASNDGGNADRAFPASQDDVICVHSTDGLGNTSLFNPTALSNTDNFCVVGENVEAAWPSETTDKLGGLRRMSGTSVAAAVAVAIAALMIGFVGHNIPEHVGWAIPLKSRDGIKAIFQTISERRNGQYDLVNPIKAFGGGSEDERKKILRDVEARLR